MEVRYDLVVDFARPSKSNTIMISEDDNCRVCHFTLLNNKQPMSMSDVVSATVRGIKKDGSVIFGDVEVVKDENDNPINELNYTIPKQISDTAGIVTMTVTLMSETSQQLTSFEFYLQIRNALYNEDDLVSESDLSGFRQLIERCEDAIKKVEELTLEDTLPNPFPLNITIEGDTTQYSGRKEESVELSDMVYLSEDPEIEVQAIDETSAQSAAQSAVEAREYADQAYGSATRAAESERKSSSYAESARGDASSVHDNIGLANTYRILSEGYAKGTVNDIPSEDFRENNAKYYSERAEYYASRFYAEDRLDSSEKDRPLSANMGRVLNDIKADKSSITGFETQIEDLETNKADKAETSAIKESLTQYEQSGFLSYNLWDEHWQLGDISSSDGKISASQNYMCSSLIDIQPSTEIFLRTPNTIRKWCYFYKADGTYLGSATVIRGNSNEVFSTPSEAYLMRFMVSVSDYGSSTYRYDICLNLNSEKNGTYNAYAMSNQGLTQITDELKQSLSQLEEVTSAELVISASTSSVSRKKVKKCGNIVTVNLNCSLASTVANRTIFATIPSGYRPSEEQGIFIRTGNNIRFGGISADGTIQSFTGDLDSTVAISATYIV